MRRYQSGFTIIELMVTLAVLAIVMAIAIPSFTGQIQRNSSLAIGEDFVTALNFARNEAIKRKVPISICPSNDDGTQCGTSWSAGWMVFVDGAPSEAESSATVSEVLRLWSDINPRAEITVSRGGASADFIRFAGMGVLARIGGAMDSVNITAQLANCSGEASREINIGPSGMVNSRPVQCGSSQ